MKIEFNVDDISIMWNDLSHSKGIIQFTDINTNVTYEMVMYRKVMEKFIEEYKNNIGDSE